MLRRAAPFAGSAAGEPAPKLSKIASRRASSKFVADLSSGLAMLASVRHPQDLTFVFERFEDSDLVSTVATLMRAAGHWRQAVANMMEQDKAEGDRGKQLPPSTTTFRCLNEGFCKKLRTTFEPGICLHEDGDSGQFLEAVVHEAPAGWDHLDAALSSCDVVGTIPKQRVKFVLDCLDQSTACEGHALARHGLRG